MNKPLHKIAAALGIGLLAAVGFIWATPILWMFVAAFRPDSDGGASMASLVPNSWPTLAHISEAWIYGNFVVFYINNIILVVGILAVQCVTVTMAGYAFARLTFPGRNILFLLFLFQLMLIPPLLIVPNLMIVTKLGLYDHLAGVMAPYWASAFGTFLMRQTFRNIPVAFEEAAIMDGAKWWQIIIDVLIPLAKPGLVTFSIISITSHWNEFLWPLMVLNSPDKQVLTVGLSSFTKGAEGASDWGLIAAGTCLVAVPLLVAFVAFQRQFVSSFMFHGVK